MKVCFITINASQKDGRYGKVSVPTRYWDAASVEDLVITLLTARFSEEFSKETLHWSGICFDYKQAYGLIWKDMKVRGLHGEHEEHRFCYQNTRCLKPPYAPNADIMAQLHELEKEAKQLAETHRHAIVKVAEYLIKNSEIAGYDAHQLAYEAVHGTIDKEASIQEFLEIQPN